MRGWVAAMVCAGVVFAAGSVLAAQPGVTTAERAEALELHKRLTANKVSRPLARAITHAYLARAYAIDVEPAQALAKTLRRKKLGLSEKDQVKYFGAGLDALIRGAKLKDIQTTVRLVLKGSYGKTDTASFIESFLGAGSRQASPAALAKLTAMIDKNGMAGRRRREFIAWVLEQVDRGEDPDHILRIYDAIDRIVPTTGGQRKYLEKCYGFVRRGLPPLEWTMIVERIAGQLETENQLNDRTDRIIRLWLRGEPLTEAADDIVPPIKKEAGDDDDDEDED